MSAISPTSFSSNISGFDDESLDDCDFFLGIMNDENYCVYEDEHGDDSYHDDFILDSLSSSSDGSASNSMVNSSLKRKRIRNRRRIFAPRILKRDIRRYYPVMMANVFNSYDEKTVESFLGAFAAPDMRIRKNALLELSCSPLFEEQFRSDILPEANIGCQWTYIHFLVMKSMFPDQAMHIVSSQLLTRSDTQKTILSIQVRFDFTRLHDVHPLLLTDDIFEALVLNNDSNNATDPSHPCRSLESYKSKADPFQYFQNKVGKEMPRLNKPQPISFVATMLWHINETKQLEMFELVSASFV